MESLLYSIFVANSESCSVGDLARVLNVNVSQVQAAMGVACRLGFVSRVPRDADKGEVCSCGALPFSFVCCCCLIFHKHASSFMQRVFCNQGPNCILIEGNNLPSPCVVAHFIDGKCLGCVSSPVLSSATAWTTLILGIPSAQYTSICISNVDGQQHANCACLLARLAVC